MGGIDHPPFNEKMPIREVVKKTLAVWQSTAFSLITGMPLPFRMRDIVKVDSWYEKPYYGVISHDWKLPEKREWIKLWMPLELYLASCDEFDYTDGTGDCILNYSLCPDEELPADEQVLKLIGAVRQGKLDALQYLTEHYGEEDFAKESVNVGPGHAVYHSHLPSREDVRETMRIWKETLEDRYKGDGFIYVAGYREKERYWPGQIEGSDCAGERTVFGHGQRKGGGKSIR